MSRRKNIGDLNYASPIQRDPEEVRRARERRTELVIVVAAVLFVVLLSSVVALI